MMVQTSKGDKTAGRDVLKKNGKVVVLTSGEARFSGLGTTPKRRHFLGFSMHQSCVSVQHSFVSNARLKACSLLC